MTTSLPFPSLSDSLPISLFLAALSLSVFEREITRVEAGPRQGPEHFRPVIGSRGQKGLHTGSNVL